MYALFVTETRHPYRDVARTYWIAAAFFGVVGVGFNALSLAIGAGLAWSILPFVVVASGFCAALARGIDHHGRSATELGRAADLIARGFLEEAEREHAKIPAGLAKKHFVLRNLAVQRGVIALIRGDAAGAETIVTEAIDASADPITAFVAKNADAVQKAEAQAIRAIARAQLGKDALAEADAKAVEAAPVVTPYALGRAALARALIQARREDRSELERFIATKYALVLEHTSPRERMLARSLHAVARPEGAGIYREPAAAEAPFAQYNDAALPNIDAAAAQRVGAVRLNAARSLSATTKGKARLRVGILWAILCVMFLTIWQFLAPAPPSEAPPAPEPVAVESSATPSILLAVLGPLVLAAAMSFLFLSTSKREREILQAMRARAEGSREAAEKRLNELAKHRNGVLALQARLALVMYANQRGDFTGALALSDEAIALASRAPTVLRVARDVLLPSIIAERAVALAALGYETDAETELAMTLASNPWYARAAAATFRVRLISAARKGDLATASAIARTRTLNLPLDLATDLLADVILEASGARTTSERRRTQRELAELPEVAAWIDAVAPGVRTAERARIAPGLEEQRREEEEEEAQEETETFPKRAARVDDKA